MEDSAPLPIIADPRHPRASLFASKQPIEGPCWTGEVDPRLKAEDDEIRTTDKNSHHFANPITSPQVR